MKTRIAAFVALILATAFVIAFVRANPVSGFQSPLGTPALTSPLNAPTPASETESQNPFAMPTFSSQYVGKELVLTQEAQYVIQVATTHSALATLAWTPTYTLSLTPSPISSLPPIATTTPTPNQ